MMQGFGHYAPDPYSKTLTKILLTTILGIVVALPPLTLGRYLDRRAQRTWMSFMDLTRPAPRSQP